MLLTPALDLANGNFARFDVQRRCAGIKTGMLVCPAKGWRIQWETVPPG